MATLRVGDTPDEFMAGLQTVWGGSSLSNGAATYVRNVDFGRAPGRIAKRKGTAIYITSNGAGRITGLHEHITNLSVKTLFASTSNGAAYALTGPGTWTSVLTGLGTDDVEFATFTNLCIAVNKNISAQKSTGSNFSVLLGLPPANAKFVIMFKNRLWMANTSAGKSRLHFSAEGSAEDWTTVGSAGYIDINADDGDEITGIAACGANLFIFKRFSIHILTGYRPDNFVVSATPVFEGCISHRSIVNMGTFLTYLSDRAVHSIAPGGFTSELSVNIKGDIEDLTVTQKLGAVGGKHLQQYWLAFDSNGDGANDQAYVLDFGTKSWSQYDNIKARIFKTLQDTTMLSGGSDLMIIRKHDTTENDESTPITMRWRSKQYDLTNFTDIKIIHDIMMMAEVLAGKTLKMKIYIDGLDMDDEITFTLDALVAGNTTVVQYVKGLQVEQGRHVQLEFYNDESSAPVVMEGFEINCDVKAHQFWGPGPLASGNPSGQTIRSGDTFVATRIVAVLEEDGTDTTIQDAIDNLPATGGSIYIKQGTFTLTETVELPDKPVEIIGTGDGTIIDLDDAAISAFTVSQGVLTESRRFALRGFQVTGTEVPNQRIISTADDEAFAVIELSDLKSDGIQIPIEIADVDQDLLHPVNIYVRDCWFVPVSDDSGMLVNSNGLGGLMKVAFYNVDFMVTPMSAVGGTINGDSFSTLDVSMYNCNISYVGEDGLSTIHAENCRFFNFSATTDSIFMEGNYVTDEYQPRIAFINCEMQGMDLLFDTGGVIDGGYYLNTLIEAYGAASNCIHIKGVNFRLDGSATPPIPDVGSLVRCINGINGLVTVDGCYFSNTGVDPTCFIDAVSLAVIKGNTFSSLAAPSLGAIRLGFGGGGTNNHIHHNTFAATTVPPILETGASDLNIINDNRFIATTTAPTIIGASTIFNGSKTFSGTGTTTTALVDLVTHTNPKGLTGCGTIKNTAGTNGLVIRRTAIDAFGTTSTADDTVALSATFTYPMDEAVGTALPPFVSFKVSVRSAVAGNHTTYSLKHLSQGAIA